MRVILLVISLCVSLSTSAEAQEAHAWPLHTAIATSMTADAMDLSITMYALGRGGFYEANPIFRPLTNHPLPFAIAKMGTAAAVNMYLLHLHKDHPRLAVLMAVGNTALKTWIALRNQRLVCGGTCDSLPMSRTPPPGAG